MGRGRVTPQIRDGDWSRLRQVIDRLSTIILGSEATPTFAGLTLTGLTPDRLIGSASGVLQSEDLTSWIAGTSNQISVADDSDGSVTLSTPQDIHTGASPTFAGLIIADGGTIGQAAGPLMTFNDTSNYLGITGCRVGIGTLTPEFPFVVALAGGLTQASFETYSETPATQPYFALRKSHSNVLGTKTTTLDGDSLGLVGFYGIDSGSNWDVGAFIEAFQNGDAGIRVPTDLKFRTCTSTALNTNQLVLNTSGNVGIGVSDPDTRLEIFNAGNQLKLSFDATDNVIFAVDTNGNLTITPSGTGVTVAGTLAAGVTTITANNPTNDDFLKIINSSTGAEGILRLSGAGNLSLIADSSNIVLMPASGANIALNIEAGGILGFVTDGVGDIGAVADFRPNNIYAKNGIVADGSFTVDALILTPNTIENSSTINLKPSGDDDDYFTFATTSHVPIIGTAGGANLKITADGGTIDFDNEDLTTIGTVGIGIAAQSNERLNILMGASDTRGIHVDGSTNDLDYSGVAVTGINSFSRDISGTSSAIGTFQTHRFNTAWSATVTDKVGDYDGINLDNMLALLTMSGTFATTNNGPGGTTKTYTANAGKFTNQYIGDFTTNSTSNQIWNFRSVGQNCLSEFSPGTITSTSGFALYQGIGGLFEANAGQGAITHNYTADTQTIEWIGGIFAATGQSSIANLASTSIAAKFSATLSDTNIAIQVDAGTSKLKDAKIGDGGTTDYSEFEADGTLEFNGAATVWKDINMGAGVLSGPPGLQPGIVNFVDENGADTGIATFGLAVGEGLSGAFEIQHDYKEGSDITFHVHWQGIAAPTETDKVQFQLTYTVASENTSETLDAVTIITAESDFDTQYESLKTDFTVITGTNFEIGDQFLFTIERIAASANEYGGEALLETVGIHYEIDTIGSRAITTK